MTSPGVVASAVQDSTRPLQDDHRDDPVRLARILAEAWHVLHVRVPQAVALRAGPLDGRGHGDPLVVDLDLGLAARRDQVGDPRRVVVGAALGAGDRPAVALWPVCEDRRSGLTGLGAG